jgi:GNAT superfamily N-acetyltransferase
MTDSHPIQIVRSQPEYAAEMERLYRMVYGDDDPTQADVDVLTAPMFQSHQRVFPAGQFVALDTSLPDGQQVIGLTASMRIRFDLARPIMPSWYVTTGDGWLTTHDPCGEWLYGVESCVHPAYRGQGIGGRLIDVRFDLAQRLNLRGMVAGSALMSYYKVAQDGVSAEDYVRGVVAGRYVDVNLSKQLHKGFTFSGTLLPNYVVDAEAHGWGALIVWHNPTYDAAAGAQHDSVLRALPLLPMARLDVRVTAVSGKGF